MKKILLLLLLFFILPASSFASQNFLTVVNPVRDRHLWQDQSLKPILDQYHSINALNLPATWLLQYDTFFDFELQGIISQFNSDQEVGIFLEVSPTLAQKARVLYPLNRPWYDPSAVFLSGYSRSDRRRLINTLWSDFKTKFGHYPRSIGAWWIDSYSLQYITKKYGLDTVMIVADQKTTDNYGIWGQWWGIPYWPSRSNIQIPESSTPSLPIVIQWAQRDPVLGFGTGQSSLYSLQANDYSKLGLNISYFKSLAMTYLTANDFNQITIGLETGMESIGYETEFKQQLTFLKNLSDLKAVTMSQFGRQAKVLYPQNPVKATVGQWVMTSQSRTNHQFQETINYQPIAWSDSYFSDQSSFLNRQLPQPTFKPPFPTFQVVFCSLIILSFVLGLYFPKFFWLAFFPSTFGLDWLISLIRYTVIDGQRYLGIVINTFDFISIPRFLKLSNLQAQTLIHFPFDQIWSSKSLSFLVYPLIHLLLALLVSRLPHNLRKRLVSILTLFACFWVYTLVAPDK